MNQPLRALDWKATFVPDSRRAESDASKDLFNEGRTESEFVAALTKNWSERKAEERFRSPRLSAVENREAGGKQQTEAPTEKAVPSFSIPRFQISALTRPRATFVPLQEWEGYVVALNSSHVVANLVDLTNDAQRPDEQADIPLEEFSEDDAKKLSVGRVFRWAIGYQRLPSGTKMRVSQFVVRDLPQWTRRELNEAKREAADLADFFNKPE
jgi:hypothetical protein